VNGASGLRALMGRAKWGVAAFCLALACVAGLVTKATELFPGQVGMDFYQFWGVPAAKQLSTLRDSPYADRDAYARVLNELSDASTSARLRMVNGMRRTLQPLGTPFFYASFSALPVDYERAHVIYAILQHLAAGLAVFLLARLRGCGVWTSVAIAAVVELTFNPFVQDVKVGNVNSLQLLFLAMLLHVAVRRRYSGNDLVDGLFLGSIALFLAFKPNTPWIALSLAIHYAVAHGRRRFLYATGVSAVMGLLAFLVGILYFGDPRVWWDWLQYARNMEGAGTLQQGNLSITSLLAQGSPAIGAAGFALLVAALLSIALFMALTRHADALAGGRREALRQAWSDPWFAVSVGVVFTFATYPLVWPHYHLLALVPMFWLFRRNGRWDWATGCVVASYAGFSRPALHFVSEQGLIGASLVMVLFSWAVLLPALFAYGPRQGR
jgi:hypothetical protein